MSAKFAVTEEGQSFPLNSVAARWRLEVLSNTDGPSLTRQEFAEECDINFILKGYEDGKMAWPPPPPGKEGVFVDWCAVPGNLQDALNQVAAASEAFMKLPAKVRKEFDNDPVRFVDFAVDSGNLEKLREWGLAPPAVAPPEDVGPPPASAPAAGGGAAPGGT